MLRGIKMSFRTANNDVSNPLRSRRLETRRLGTLDPVERILEISGRLAILVARMGWSARFRCRASTPQRRGRRPAENGT